MSGLKKRFLNSSIAAKFRTIYIVLIVVCIFINAVVAHQFYNREVRNGIAGLASQTIETISGNVDSSLSSIAKASTYLLGTSDVQEYLMDEQDSRDAISARNLRNALYLSMESMPLVSSIMILHEDGSYDGAARHTFPEFALTQPSQADWYEEVQEKRGAPIYTVNGGGYIKSEDGKNYISLVRRVNSTEDASPLGYMMINISVDSLLSFAREDDDGYSDICVYLQDQALLGFLNEDLNTWVEEHSPETLPERSDVTVGNDRYLFLRIEEESQDWYYLSAIRYGDFSSRGHIIVLMFCITVLVSGILFLLIAFFSRKFITTPIEHLMEAMKVTEEGEFRPACVAPYEDEIAQLQSAYNSMVEKIRQLLKAKIQEQKLLRKAELSTLQEQIKPHFLYNSLSAIAYLITSGQNDRAYEMILSLSDYYRESLSKGSEIVDFETELNIVKNYLKLQKMRYPELFEDVYEISESVREFKVPRLILQPLAENALYHGILPLGDCGTITITAELSGEDFVITISDDGVGMTKDRLEEVMGGRLRANARSFGLRGTIERLRIFYETDNIYEIKSTPETGTVITLRIPADRAGGEAWNNSD